MYFITGDTHRNFDRIKDFCNLKKTSVKDVMIILGDAGINYCLDESDIEFKRFLSKLPITLFCIKGNHEKYPDTISSYKQREWNNGIVFYEEDYPNLLFAKDGEIYNINEKKCITIGGAYSVDKFYRLANGYRWFEDEQPSVETKTFVEEQLSKNNWKVDVVLSHTSPINMMPRHLFISQVDQKTVDNSTELWLQDIMDKLYFTNWYFGHFHGEWTIDNFRLLFNDIIEF